MVSYIGLLPNNNNYDLLYQTCSRLPTRNYANKCTIKRESTKHRRIITCVNVDNANTVVDVSEPACQVTKTNLYTKVKLGYSYFSRNQQNWIKTVFLTEQHGYCIFESAYHNTVFLETEKCHRQYEIQPTY
ncbi:hypothetical protein Tsp_04755 [Trichinella spiralis]|uniref:hypothetical protein n=1 Tax=Trichinella spiralis TaxID=6334 RepID=UPI0001EFDBF3|nr:hypothetical protein Tsp_04755 [Trichinella spiralis]